MKPASFPGPVERGILAELAPAFASRDVEAAGARLRLLEGGSGSAVILLPGRGSAATSWFPVLNGLAARHRVVALDLPGFGSSSGPPAPATHDVRSALAFFTDPIEAFLSREGLENAAVVGHSLGGYVAVELALRGVAKPSKLVLIGSMGLGPQAAFAAKAFFRVGPERLARMLGPSGFRKLSPFPNTALGHRVGALAYELLIAPGGRAEAQRAFTRLVPWWGPAPNEFGRLDQIATETLLLWGERDEAIPAPIAIAAATRLPRARIHMTPLGHSPHAEDPERVLPVLLDFLR